jgi:molybdopterin-guanine dinucleotide biosynthesis protein A
VLPRTSAGFEPLCAAYSRRCLKPAEDHLRANKLKIHLALKDCRIKTISEDRLRAKDPDLVSFFNVNTPQDLARAEQMLNAGKTTEAAWTSPP